MRLKSILIFTFFLLQFSVSFGQLDSLRVHFTGMATFGTEGYAPFWITSNRYGIFNESINDALLMPGFHWPVKIGKKLNIETGFDLAIKRNLEETFIYQGYVNLRLGKLTLMMGRQEFTLGQYSEDLSSGSFLVSNNAKPIPRIGIGFYDYVEIPYTKGWLYVKGAINHGWLDNDRLEHSKFNKPLLHEKFLYLKTGNIPINPHIGLIHTAIYGGEDANGKKAGVDYWAVFFGKGSSVSDNRGEETNALGEHLGILDFGLNTSLVGYDFTFYYQIPITSSGGYTANFSRNKDFILGLLMEREGKSLLTGFTYEWVRTNIQLGEGIPDPNVDGKFIVPSDPADQEFLRQYYSGLGYPVEDFTTEREWWTFLETYNNYGLTYGGREDYYNNYLFKHIYNDRVIGNPLFITKPTLQRWANNSDGPYVISNRILGHHFGLRGWFMDQLQYRLLFTFTRNRGAWQEYGGRTKWEGIKLDPDFDWYWKGDRDQYYTLLELGYHPERWKNFEFTLGMGYDFGEIYSNFGFLGIIRYQFQPFQD
jgi:hypothetical protein